MIYENEDQQNDADSITALRILDTLYAILVHLDPEKATKLIDKHEKGGLISPTIVGPVGSEML